jgi:hypothetical protein
MVRSLKRRYEIFLCSQKAHSEDADEIINERIGGRGSGLLNPVLGSARI